MSIDKQTIWFIVTFSLRCVFADSAEAGTVVRLPQPTHTREASEADVERFLLDRDLSPEEWEQLTVLSARSPDVVVPAVLARIESARKSGEPQEYIDHLANVVAYAAEDKAVEGLTQLALADETRYTPFLLAALGYAFDVGRGFTLAFSAAGRSEAIDKVLADWIATHVGQRRDAESLLTAIATWRGANDLESLIATEPLLAGLPETAARELRAAAVDRESRRQRE